jgi:hypothetical protein
MLRLAICRKGEKPQTSSQPSHWKIYSMLTVKR